MELSFVATILHLSDVHIGTAFDSFPDRIATVCKQAQFDALQKVVDTANAQHIQVILIAGNLFAMPVPSLDVAQRTFEILSNAQCEVLISPGNYDYLHEESPYRVLEFAENIHVFDGCTLQSFSIDDNTVIWGAAYQDTAEHLRLNANLDPSKCNILLLHASVQDQNGQHLLTQEQLEYSGFDYAALGYQHAYTGVLTAGKTVFCCSGNLAGRGFSEPDTHGFVCGTVSKAKAEMQFIPSESICFLNWQQPMEHIQNDRELSRIIADRILHSRGISTSSDSPAPDFSRSCLCLTLTGNRIYEPDVSGLFAALDTVFLYACVENDSVPPQNIWRYESQEDIRGAVTRNFRFKYERAVGSEKKQVLYALKVMLAAFEGEDFPLMH